MVDDANRRTLQYPRVFEGILQYGLLDGREDKSNVRCIGSLRQTGRVSGKSFAVQGKHTEDINSGVPDSLD